MKKILALVLSVSLLASVLTLPALALEDTDRRLSAVALTVKTTLGLDTDRYDEFYGDLRENVLAPTWSLHWTGEGESLSITATESGKILSYSLSSEEVSPYRPDQPPHFPVGDRQKAQEAAQAFVGLVLDGKRETAVLTPGDTEQHLNATEYRYTANIQLDRYPSPLNLFVSVRCADNVVTSFRRDDLDGSYLGGIPTDAPKYDTSQAMNLLKTTLKLHPEYVLEPDSTTAQVRYLPVYGDDFYVDAVTGELINLTALYEKLGPNAPTFGTDGAVPGAGESVSKDETLTEAEQAGVEKMAGVLSKETLGEKVSAAYPQLGLEKYALVGADYRVDRPNPEDETAPRSVVCTLTYGRQEPSGVYRRMVTVDGKTAALQSVNSTAPWIDGQKATVSAARAQRNAEAFLKAHYGDTFAKTALYPAENPPRNGELDPSFTFAQKENGYFFPENNYHIAIDGKTGDVSRFYFQFDDSVTFSSVENLITPTAALDAYFAAHSPAKLSLLAVPAAVDLAAPDIRPLLEELGYRFLYSLKLGFSLDRRYNILGVDGATGEVLIEKPSEPSHAFTYTDLTSHWGARQIETLGAYGIGYPGDTFQPAKPLSQLDFLVLFTGVEGYRYDPTRKNAADALYDCAYRMDLLAPSERNDDLVLTRGALTKLLLDYAGYEEVAALENIFRCDFADREEIPPQYVGYAALAQGMGLVTGDQTAAFAPSRPATRSEAAVILHHYLSR